MGPIGVDSRHICRRRAPDDFHRGEGLNRVLAHAGKGERMYRNILIAYDGSEGAEAALGQAARLARGSGAALTLVRSTENSDDYIVGRGMPHPDRAAEAAARHSLERAISRLDPELDASPWVISGKPARGILAVADEIAADLIVTGSRGLGRVARAMLGSTSSALATNASCDVLVVPPRER
jgi:nucleotide-binding universal stress UspA family protein